MIFMASLALILAPVVVTAGGGQTGFETVGATGSLDSVVLAGVGHIDLDEDTIITTSGHVHMNGGSGGVYLAGGGSIVGPTLGEVTLAGGGIVVGADDYQNTLIAGGGTIGYESLGTLIAGGGVIGGTHLSAGGTVIGGERDC